MADDALLTLAGTLGTTLKKHGLVLALAESCTGGWAAQAVTAIPGSSGWFDRGFVTYSNAAKVEMLGVSESTLATDGAVSEEVAQEMVLGVLKHSKANIAASITGIAGPDGGSTEKPVGMVCFAWAGVDLPTISSVEYFSGDRQEIREQAVVAALSGLLKLIA